MEGIDGESLVPPCARKSDSLAIYLSLPCHIMLHIEVPRFLSLMASHDVASSEGMAPQPLIYFMIYR